MHNKTAGSKHGRLDGWCNQHEKTLSFTRLSHTKMFQNLIQTCISSGVRLVCGTVFTCRQIIQFNYSNF
jgi:hypothetical protein